MASQLVIGVIGGTKGAGAQARSWASDLGRLIVNTRSILLTGGKPDPNEDSVKARAMCSAKDAGDASAPAGMIGVVPREPGGVVLGEGDPARYSLLLYTGVSSYERNVLTGVVPDATIVLAGEGGTLSETAYAIAARRPLLFLGSRSTLRRSLAASKNEVRKIIDQLGERSYPSAEMVGALEEVLAADSSAPAYPAYDVASAEEAMSKLNSLCLTSLGVKGRYPTLMTHQLRRFRQDFELKLERLEFLLQQNAPSLGPQPDVTAGAVPHQLRNQGE